MATIISFVLSVGLLLLGVGMVVVAGLLRVFHEDYVEHPPVLPMLILGGCATYYGVLCVAHHF